MKGKGNGKIDTVHELDPSTSALAGYGAGDGVVVKYGKLVYYIHDIYGVF